MCLLDENHIDNDGRYVLNMAIEKVALCNKHCDWSSRNCQASHLKLVPLLAAEAECR